MKKRESDKIPFFVSIPHSGLKIPPIAKWLEVVPNDILMCDVDHFVDDLYAPALKEFQIPSVFFEWHRYALDVNRFAEDISPLTIAKELEVDLNKQSQKKNYQVEKQIKRKKPSDIHWHKTTQGDILIKKPISKKLHQDLIEQYFEPFHKKIREQIADFKRQGHKDIYLLDLHSMPSQGLAFHRDQGESRKPIVISDNEGQSCSKAFRDLVVKAYQQVGFEVALNWPYKGGAITQQYGQPQKDQNVLQVELNRQLYMDEQTKEKTSDYKKVQKQLKQALAFILENLKK